MTTVLWPFALSAQTRSIVFPIDGETNFRNDFLEPRDGGARDHLGNDIFADKMTPVVAVVDGVISYIPFSEPSWGYMITIQDKDRYQYRYIHLNNDTPGTDDGKGGVKYAYAPNLKRGTEVRAGQLLGWVGDSGNAENVTSMLHFEIRKPNKSAINPYDSLITAASPKNIAKPSVAKNIVVHESVGNAGVDEGAELIFTIELKEGMQGFAIKELQSRLKDAGHFNQGLTNYFGPITKAALQSYQRANNIAPSGIFGFETRALINGETNIAGTLLLKKELFEGDKGDSVLQVQLKLEELGYYSGDTNGEFDSVLREAIRSFQNQNSVPPTGFVNFATWNALNESYKATPKSVASNTRKIIETSLYTSSGTLSIGSRGSDVVALQDRLRELGHFSKNIVSTGYFGPVTRAAVVSFQAANDIETVGYVGPQTLAALNDLYNTPQTTSLVRATSAEVSPTTKNVYTFTKALDIGSRGGEVIALQDTLRDLGHFSSKIISTGYFGPVTYKAVISFQKSKGIEAIGFVGPKTRTALNSI